MGIKALFIAPYRGLKELATVLASNEKDLDVIVEEADLSAAIPIVKANESQGIQFIISRGGTAKMISQYTNLPVIEIKLSGYDILRTLTLIKDYQMKVHMIGFPNICNDVLSISSLLNIDISYTIVYQKEEVEEAVKQAWEQGAQLILGDTITVNTAERFGLQGMMITSGKEAVLEAFDQVRQMNQVINRVENEHVMYQQLLEKMQDGVIIFEENGTISFANQPVMQKLFPKAKGKELLSIFNLPEEFSQLITEVLTTTMPIHSTITLNGESQQIIAGRLDKAGYYYFHLHEKTEVETAATEVHKGRVPRTSFAQLVTSSSVMQQLLVEAREVALKDKPIIVWGKEGVGKRFLASAIHSESKLQDGPFVEIGIKQATPSVVKEIKQHLSKLPKTTVYVTGLEQLAVEDQLAVINVFHSNQTIRVIYSYNSHPGEDNRLTQLVGEFLYMPTLTERADDFEELIRLFVSIFNAEFGKQVVGIKKDAISFLQSIDWNGNVKQLKRVVKELVNASSGDFIEVEHVHSVSVITKEGREGTFIDLTKTLEEIEKEIIYKVLKEENMNQTKAAKRLGINRTTLWRKIN